MPRCSGGGRTGAGGMGSVAFLHPSFFQREEKNIKENLMGGSDQAVGVWGASCKWEMRKKRDKGLAYYEFAMHLQQACKSFAVDLHKGVAMGLKLVCNGFASGLKWASKVPNETAEILQRVCNGSTMGVKGAYNRPCNGLQGVCKSFTTDLQGACNEFAVGLQEV